jgi:hypothetical protein
MAKFYSPSTMGFYDPDIHGSDMPQDAAPITDSEYRALTSGPQGLPAKMNEDPGMRADFILGKLREIDAKKMRAVTDAILHNDISKLSELEAEAVSLREELSTIVQA